MRLTQVNYSCLAWQKGQGIPQRYRKAQDQYQALVLDIEMTERSFVGLDTNNNNNTTNSNGANPTLVKLNPRTERDRLQRLYDTARADQQANYPDLYVSTGVPGAKNTIDFSKQLEAVNAEAAKVSGALMGRIEALIGRLEGEAEGRIDGVLRGVGGGVSGVGGLKAKES